MSITRWMLAGTLTILVAGCVTGGATAPEANPDARPLSTTAIVPASNDPGAAARPATPAPGSGDLAEPVVAPKTVEPVAVSTPAVSESTAEPAPAPTPRPKPKAKPRKKARSKRKPAPKPAVETEPAPADSAPPVN